MTLASQPSPESVQAPHRTGASFSGCPRDDGAMSDGCPAASGGRASCHEESLSVRGELRRALTPQSRGLTDRRRDLPRANTELTAMAGGLLLVAVIGVFGQTLRHGFVNYDDNLYVYENAALTRGLSVEGLKWAISTVDGNFWHPATWLSLLVDYQCYGLSPWGYHLANVLLHAANSILLMVVLRRMTGSLGASAFVAGVFALHPLHVESVAWIAERKDVLSGLFFMLTLWAYVAYVRRPSVARYAGTTALFALGLMAKPVMVTLPFVLLLLDYWPLARMRGAPTDRSNVARRRATLRRLVLEKLPWLGLTAIFCFVTPLAEGAAVVGLDTVPMSWRLANIPVAYLWYLGKSFWPFGLAPAYPHPGSTLSAWQVAASLALLIGISAAAFAARRRLPYLFVGWFWYLGMLVPMIGLLQVGEHGMADRYTYLPQIGLSSAMAWGGMRLAARWPRLRRIRAAAAGLAVAGLAACAYVQAGYWRDSETLWTHALECEPDNAVAHTNLGHVLANRRRLETAIGHYREAVRIRPHESFGHVNLGIALATAGRHDAAIAEYETALRIDPDDLAGHMNLGVALANRGQFDEAVAHFRRASSLRPDLAGPYQNLAAALYARGAHAEAVAMWRRAAALEPNEVPIVNALAWALATCPNESVRNGAEAIELAERAVRLCGGQEAAPIDALAAAYAEAGRFREAAGLAGRAVALAALRGDSAAVDAMRRRMERYESQLAEHDASGSNRD